MLIDFVPLKFFSLLCRPSFGKAGVFVILCTLVFGAASNGLAAEYYWRGTEGSHVWTDIVRWRTARDGTGTHPSPISSADTFIEDGTTAPMGTAMQTTAGIATFAGGTLILASDGQISVKGTGRGVAQIMNLVTTGGGLIVAAHTPKVVHNLDVVRFDNRAGDTRLSASTLDKERTLNLTIGTLVGAGNFTIDSLSGSAQAIFISVADATDYTGGFHFESGLVDFNNDLVSAGSLTVSGTAKIRLDSRVSFNSVTIGGTVLDPGTYDADDLAAYDAFFDGEVTGSITSTGIPVPSTYALFSGVIP